MIERELRVQSRKSATYYARFLWGLAAVGILGIVAATAGSEIQDGAYLLSIIHRSLLTIFLIVSPLVAADSISRERREGTLGLLFLTPLTARQVILGKFASHALRLFYLWLTFVPLLLLPIMAGGVGIEQISVSIVILFAVLLGGISAGMLASAVSIPISVAVFRSLLLAGIAYVALAAVAVNAPAPWLARGFYQEESLLIRILLVGPYFLFLPSHFINAPAGVFGALDLGEIAAAILLTSATVLMALTISFCARRIRRYAETGILTARRIAFRRRYLTPIIRREQFRRSMQNKLSQNPFLWLEYREPWARAARLAALLMLLATETFVVIGEPRLDTFLSAQFYLLVALVIAITLKSTTSFQYEKESGAIELILVSPITERALISGRLGAVLSYYRPVTIALMIFMLIAVFWLNLSFSGYDSASPILLSNFWFSVFSIPVAGLFFALRCKSFLHTLIWTVGSTLILPPLLWSSFTNLVWHAAHQWNFDLGYLLDPLVGDNVRLALVVCAVWHCIVILFCWRQALKILEKRSFADPQLA